MSRVYNKDALDLPLLLNAVGALTVICLVITLAMDISGMMPALERSFRAGFAAAGIPWIALALWDVTGSPAALWLIPSLFFLIFLAPRLLKSSRRWLADWRLKMKGGWRCPSCGKENEAIAPVCYYCQTWRK